MIKYSRIYIKFIVQGGGMKHFITGTFIDEITHDIPSQNWGRKEWRKDFEVMKKTGIDTLVIIRSGFRDEALFPSETLRTDTTEDLLQFFLDEAHRHEMRVFVGSYDCCNLSWEWKNWQEDWNVNQRFIPEIHRRYGSHPAFYGWYIAPETCIACEGTYQVFGRHSEMMKELTPDKPVLISPYYPSYVFKDDTPAVRQKKFQEHWGKIFSKVPAIDICAFQDGSCNFHTDESDTAELAEYVRNTHTICREFDVIQWNNIETFGRRYGWKFPPIDWRLLEKKLALSDPYVEKQITFEFSHFMSPNAIYPSAHFLYDRYMEKIVNNRPIFDKK